MFGFDETVSLQHGCPISLTDESGRRLLVSDQFAELLRRPKDDLLGMPWRLVSHAEDVEIGALATQRLLESGVPSITRRRLIAGDGQVLDVLLFGTRLLRPKTRRYVVQANLKLAEQPIAMPNGYAAEVADYIRDMALGLARMADDQRMDALRHLLETAGSEAAKQLKLILERDWDLRVQLGTLLH